MKQKKIVLVALVSILFTVVAFFGFVYVFERIENKKSAEDKIGDFNYEDATQVIPPPVTEGLGATPSFEEATLESEQQ